MKKFFNNKIKALSWAILSLTYASFSTAGSTAEQIDSDGDGVVDAVEIRHGLDPNKAYDVWRDKDGDHLPFIYELREGLDNSHPDNDIFNNQRLLFIQALSDIQGKMADQDELQRMFEVFATSSLTPSLLYLALLDEQYFARMGFVGRVYQALLQRTPDVDGVRYYYHQLDKNLSKQQVIEQMIHSKEFKRLYGELSDAGFINLAYQNIHNQPIAAQKQAFFIQGLESGRIDRARLMLLFVDGKDYIKTQDLSSRVNVLHLLLTHQLPTAGQNQQYQQWLAATDNENGKLDLLRSILASDQYRQSTMPDIGPASHDSDGDGRPDGEEFALGTDTNSKDNDVLGDDRQFVRQMQRDVFGAISTEQQTQTGLASIKRQGRSGWVMQLLDLTHNGSEQLIADLFHTLYRRNASAAELSHWQQRLDNGTDIKTLVAGLLGSSEYQARFY